MLVFNPHSIEIGNMDSSSSSFSSSLLRRTPQKQHQTRNHRNDLTGINLRQDQMDPNQRTLPFGRGDNGDCDDGSNDPLGGFFQQNNKRDNLEQQARTFFKLAIVSDRRETRYNSHGNRGSFHGSSQRQKLYKNVFAGSEAIDSMVASGLAPSRERALALGNKMASELNLFARANLRCSNVVSSPGHYHHTKPKGKVARANLLAAQTILLGSSESSETNGLDVATSDVTAHLATGPAEGFFADDANAFYRFGPGVLAILRGIDCDYNRDRDRHLSGRDETALSSSPTKKGTARTIETVTTTDESTFGNSERDRQKKKKNGQKNQHQQQYPMDNEKEKRNLSIVPNAPGCNGKILLEDLFLIRRPEMIAPTKTAANANGAASAIPSASTKASKSSSNSKKKTKKSAAIPHKPSVPTPSPLPKSILKNGGCNKKNNNKNKKNKSASSKATKASSTSKNKTKGSHKRTTAHKTKAGAKIKYVSDKERRVASIEKRLSIYHSDQQIVSYREMLRELKNQLSRLYTKDHFEVVSLSSHSSSLPRYPPNNQHHEIHASTKGNTISVTEPTLEDDCNDFETNNAFDNALDSLDNIITSNADLLAVGNDNDSVWTEFIMGTSQVPAQANASTNTIVNANAIANTKPNLSKENPNKLGELTNVVEKENGASEMKDDSIDQQLQKKKKKKKPTPTTWQAPAPLESGGGNGSNKNKNRARCDGNEIDLSSWARINRDREKGGTKTGEHLPLPPPISFGTGTGHVSTKNNDNSFVRNGDGKDDLSLLAPDDLSLFLEQQQEREFQSLQISNRAEGFVSKGDHDCNDNSFCHVENPRKANAVPTKNRGVVTSESFRTNVTKDSNDLARLRMGPFRPKNGTETNLSSLSEKEGIADGLGPRYRDCHVFETNRTRADKSTSGSQPPPIPTLSDGDACNASDDTSSGIMEAIDQDPFYQQAAAGSNSSKQQTTTTENKTKEEKNGFDSSPPTIDDSPIRSEPGSFTASYNDRYFQDSFEDFDEEEVTIDTYSDEGSYMEVTVADEEMLFEEMAFEVIEEEVFEEELIEEEVIEEEEAFDDEIPIASETYINRNRHQSSNKMGPRPTLSPRRKTAQFRSTRSLPPVPELGPEPEPEPQPTSPQRKQSVYVEVHSMPDDDEMTQLTMDCFLSSSYRSNRSLQIIPEDDYTINNGDYTNHNSYLFPLKEGQQVKTGSSAMVSPIRNRGSRKIKYRSQLVPSTQTTRHKNQFSTQHHLKQRTKYVAASSKMGRGCNTIHSMETSQQRIQEILWKDLPNSDVTVVWGALEELRILVANESRSRAYMVRHGGVMVIINTLAEQIEVEVIQFLCCNILEQLASVDFEIGLTILELGGVSLIEQSMKKHGSSHRVKQMGDAALRSLARNP